MPKQARICVVGSANVDLTFKTARLPRPGETLTGQAVQLGFGCNGANQAVIAARLGAAVSLVARVGDDTFGHDSLRHYQRQSLDTTHIRADGQRSTGVAAILVDDQAQNCILVIPGANAALSPQDVTDAAATIGAADLLLCQLEVPLETTLAAFRVAKAAGVRTILNPAPAASLPPELLPLTDLCIPNETEIELLTGQAADGFASAEAAARTLLRRGAGAVLVTLGERGAVLVQEESETRIPGLPVDAIDTTGAGDAFIGSLAVFWAEGSSLAEAAVRASAVAALTVTRPGTQSAFPSRAEAEAFSCRAEARRNSVIMIPSNAPLRNVRKMTPTKVRFRTIPSQNPNVLRGDVEKKMPFVGRVKNNILIPPLAASLRAAAASGKQIGKLFFNLTDSRRPHQGPNLAEFAPQLLPRRPAIDRAINLAADTAGIKKLRVRGVDGEVPHRAVGPPRHLDGLPGRTAVERPRNQPRRPRRRIAVAQQQRLRLVPCTLASARGNMAAAEHRRTLERLPGVAVIDAHVHVVIGARNEPGEPRSVRSRLRHIRQRVDVLRAESLADRVPAQPAVAAAIDAVDLDAGPHRPRIARMAAQRRDARVDDARTIGPHAHVGFRPGAAAVLRAKQPRRGQTPTRRTSGSAGSSRIDQICSPFSGPSTRLQLSAPSPERNSPCSLPRYSTRGSRGWLARARTWHSTNMPSQVRVKMSPPSRLRHKPSPMVPT